jgi:hypothetical protein
MRRSDSARPAHRLSPKLWLDAVPRTVARPGSAVTRRASGLMDRLPTQALGSGACSGIGDVVVVRFGLIVPIATANHHPAVTGGLAPGRRQSPGGGKRPAAAAVGTGRNFAQIQVAWGTVFRTAAGRRRRTGDHADAARARAATVVRGPRGPDAEHTGDIRVESLTLGTTPALAATGTPIRGEAVRATRLPLGADFALAVIRDFLRLQPTVPAASIRKAGAPSGWTCALADDTLGAGTAHPRRAGRGAGRFRRRGVRCGAWPLATAELEKDLRGRLAHPNRLPIVAERHLPLALLFPLSLALLVLALATLPGCRRTSPEREQAPQHRAGQETECAAARRRPRHRPEELIKAVCSHDLAFRHERTYGPDSVLPADGRNVPGFHLRALLHLRRGELHPVPYRARTPTSASPWRPEPPPVPAVPRLPAAPLLPVATAAAVAAGAQPVPVFTRTSLAAQHAAGNGSGQQVGVASGQPSSSEPAGQHVNPSAQQSSADPCGQQLGNASEQQSCREPAGQQLGNSAEQQSSREFARQQSGKSGVQLMSREPAGQQTGDSGVLNPPLPLLQLVPSFGAHDPRVATEPGAQQVSPGRHDPPPASDAQQNAPAGSQDRVPRCDCPGARQHVPPAQGVPNETDRHLPYLHFSHSPHLGLHLRTWPGHPHARSD